MKYWLILLGCFGLVGCGQSGGLYLPTQSNLEQHKHDRFLLYRSPLLKKDKQDGSL